VPLRKSAQISYLVPPHFCKSRHGLRSLQNPRGSSTRYRRNLTVALWAESENMSTESTVDVYLLQLCVYFLIHESLIQN